MKALHEGNTRGAAFFAAQKQYAAALIADSANGIRGERNYQFNLCNLLTYHNFGVLEPGFAAVPFATVDIAALAAEAKAKALKTQVYSITKQELDENKTRFVIEYTAQPGMTVRIYSTLSGTLHVVGAAGGRETLNFDISSKKLQHLKGLKIELDDAYDSAAPVLVDLKPMKAE